MTKLFSKIYYKTFGRMFEYVKLYRIDLNTFERKENYERIGAFFFDLPSLKDSSLFTQLYDDNPKKISVIKSRFYDGNYICFAYKDNITNKLAYTRWLCKSYFYSNPMKKELSFSKNEALTLDSYTNPDYRMLGLHKKMNIQMLQWMKNNTDIRYVYMVIRCFLPHLTKYPKQLGYKPVESVFYYKKGSISNLFNHLRRKILPDAEAF